MGKKIIDTTKGKSKSNSIVNAIPIKSNINKLHISNCNEIDIINEKLPNLQKIEDLTKSDLKQYHDQFILKQCAVRVNEIFIPKPDKTKEGLDEAKVLCGEVLYNENDRDKDRFIIEKPNDNVNCHSFLKLKDKQGNIHTRFYESKDMMLILPKDDKNADKFKKRGKTVYKSKKK